TRTAEERVAPRPFIRLAASTHFESAGFASPPSAGFASPSAGAASPAGAALSAGAAAGASGAAASGVASPPPQANARSATGIRAIIFDMWRILPGRAVTGCARTSLQTPDLAEPAQEEGENSKNWNDFDHLMDPPAGFWRKN